MHTSPRELSITPKYCEHAELPPFTCQVPMSQLELRQENDRRKTLEMPLLDGDEGLTKKEAAKRRKEVGGWILAELGDFG